jgi:serine/threonine-protein phosphatase 2A regulatory subunit B'
MVYNALKLFMEINPELFDESMQHYKQRKIEYVRSSFSTGLVFDRLTVNANTPWTATTNGKRCEKKR